MSSVRDLVWMLNIDFLFIILLNWEKLRKNKYYWSKFFYQSVEKEISKQIFKIQTSNFKLCHNQIGWWDAKDINCSKKIPTSLWTAPYSISVIILKPGKTIYNHYILKVNIVKISCDQDLRKKEHIQTMYRRIQILYRSASWQKKEVWLNKVSKYAVCGESTSIYSSHFIKSKQGCRSQVGPEFCQIS